MAIPLAAAIIGSAVISAAFAYKQNQDMVEAQEDAQDEAIRQGVQNQNRLVEENYSKRKSMLGLGGQAEGPMGLAASQTGSVLTSVTGLG